MATKKKEAAPPAEPFLQVLPEDDARLLRWPPACAEAIRKAARETTYTAILPHVTAAFEAVGFPRGKVYALPASLTPDQLELVRFATDHEGFPSAGFAMPEYLWCRQAWLRGGRVLDQPFETGEPIWRALQIAAQSKEIGPRVVAKLALGTLLDVFVELCVEQKGFLLEYVGASWPDGRDFTEPAVKRIVSEVKEDLGPWAAKAADRLLTIEAEPSRFIPDAVRWPVFLALARAHPKVPIEPRWDHLVPLGIGELAEPMLECARAIPTERRATALVKALGRTGGEVAEQGAILLMGAFSSPEITAWLHGFNTKNHPVRRKYVEGLVDELAKRDPVVAETWSKLQAGQPARLKLHCKDLIWPNSASDLDPSQRKQLAKAGKLYDQRKLTAEERLSDDPQLEDPKDPETAGSFKGYIDVSVICDEEGRELYDAFVYMVDRGTIFERNKLKVVAELAQGGVVGCDPVLHDALEVALSARPRRPPFYPP